MTRFVADAAIMLGVLESPSPDPNHAATHGCDTPPANRDYTPFLKADGLKGKRIGIPRAFYYDAVTLPGEEPGLAEASKKKNAEQAKAMAEAINILEQQGAIVVVKLCRRAQLRG